MRGSGRYEVSLGGRRGEGCGRRLERDSPLKSTEAHRRPGEVGDSGRVPAVVRRWKAAAWIGLAFTCDKEGWQDDCSSTRLAATTTRSGLRYVQLSVTQVNSRASQLKEITAGMANLATRAVVERRFEAMGRYSVR